jgi:hypothetical protein
MTGTSASRARSIASLAVDRRPGATDQPMQRWIVGALVDTLAERSRVNGAEHRSAPRIHDCDHDLHGARRVEHDSVSLWATVGDLHKLARTY